MLWYLYNLLGKKINLKLSQPGKNTNYDISQKTGQS